MGRGKGAVSVFYLSKETTPVIIRRRAVYLRPAYLPCATEVVLQLFSNVAPICFELHIRRVSDIVNYRGPLTPCIGSLSNSSLAMISCNDHSNCFY